MNCASPANEYTGGGVDLMINVKGAAMGEGDGGADAGLMLGDLKISVNIAG